MPQDQTLRVKGYAELQRALARADKALKKETRDAFRRVGEGVRKDAFQRISRSDFTTKGASHFVSAAGYRVVVRQRGIAVEQSLRKTTGLHSEYGSWQMRHGLIPALEDNEQFAVQEFDKAMDEVGRIFAL